MVSVPRATAFDAMVVVIDIVPFARSVRVALAVPVTSPVRVTTMLGSGLSVTLAQATFATILFAYTVRQTFRPPPISCALFEDGIKLPVTVAAVSKVRLPVTEAVVNAAVFTVSVMDEDRVVVPVMVRLLTDVLPPTTKSVVTLAYGVVKYLPAPIVVLPARTASVPT